MAGVLLTQSQHQVPVISCQRPVCSDIYLLVGRLGAEHAHVPEFPASILGEIYPSRACENRTFGRNKRSFGPRGLSAGGVCRGLQRAAARLVSSIGHLLASWQITCQSFWYQSQALASYQTTPPCPPYPADKSTISLMTGRKKMFGGHGGT